MDEKFQAIFEGKTPNDVGMPSVNVPVREEEQITEPNKPTEPAEDFPAKEVDSESAEKSDNAAENVPEPIEDSDNVVTDAENVDEEDDSLERMWECFGELNSANDATSAKLSAMMAQLESMSREISRLAAYDKAIDTLKMSLAANQNSERNLYKEVEEYKKGTYFTNIKPFLMFLVDMLCELKKSRAQYIDDKEEFIAENNENSYNEIVGLLEFFIDSFENQMRIQGVDIISFEADSDYIAGQQRISKTVKTDDPAKNGKIAAVLSDCYMYDNTILRPAKVTAFKLG